MSLFGNQINNAKVNQIATSLDSVTTQLTQKAQQSDLDTTNARIDTIVGNTGSSNTEIVDARGTFSLLKDRMNAIDETAKHNGNRFVRALGTRLAAGLEPACLLVQGDSTGVSNTRWFYLTSQWLASKFPLYSAKYRPWNDLNQNYDFPTVLQTGSNGDAYVNFPGGSGNYLSTPDKSSFAITNDVDIQAKVNGTYYGGAYHTIVSQFGGAGQRSFSFGFDGAGHLFFWWSPDGTANTLVSSTVIVPVSDNQEIWVMVRFDADNGSGGNTVTFNTSNDGITWTQLGTPIVTAGVSSIHHSPIPLEIGSRSGGVSDLFIGKIFRVYVKNGMGGKTIVSLDAGLAFPSGITSFKDPDGNVYSVNGSVTVGNGSPMILFLNGSKSGANMAYSSDVTRFALQTPIEPQLAFISYSHNEGTNTSYQAQYEAFCNQLLTAFPNVGIVCVAQNPQLAPNPAANINAHAIRNRQIAGLSAKNNYGLIDIFRLFTETGNVASLLIDGTHPTDSTGSPLWASEVEKFLTPAIKS